MAMSTLPIQARFIRYDSRPPQPGTVTIAFHHLYLGAMLRWLADPRLKLRKEFAAAVELFLHSAAVPARASRKKSPKFKRKGA